jgi:transcriptional regulator GlxA family with amidase domain
VNRRRGPRETPPAAAELPKHVEFLLIPGFSMLALCSAIEPLRLANQLLGVAHYTWRYRTADGLPARSSCGMTIPADAKAGSHDQESPPPCLIVVAGFDAWPQSDNRLKAWLRALDRRGTILGAVDTGAFVLAAADLLTGLSPAVHWESADAFRELFPDITLSDRNHIIEGRRYLCVGGNAVLDMMLDLIERSHGRALAEQIGCRLYALSTRPPAASLDNLRDRTGDEPGELDSILKMMDERLEDRSNIDDIAALAGLSRRTLERKFRQAMNKSPAEVYLQRRLEQGRRLLRHTDLPIREVAIAAGFSSTAHFCRAYKQLFHVRPSSDRKLDPRLAGREIPLEAPASYEPLPGP